MDADARAPKGFSRHGRRYTPHAVGVFRFPIPVCLLVTMIFAVSCGSPVDAAAKGRSVTVAVRAGEVGGSAVYVGNNLFLTAAHVVGKEKAATLVQLGREWTAKLVSADFDADLALLRSDSAVDLVTVPWVGTTPPAGTPVFAVGFPAPLDQSAPTITAGVISGDRSIDGRTYLQLDAQVNPGNSGGPLLNQQGELVGIVVFKVRGADGLNFAVPFDVAKAYVAQPVSRGSPSTPTPAPTPVPTIDLQRLEVIRFARNLYCPELIAIRTTAGERWATYLKSNSRLDASAAWDLQQKYISALSRLPRPALARASADNLIAAENGFLNAILLSIRYIDTGSVTYLDQSNSAINSSNIQRRTAYDAVRDLLASKNVAYSDYSASSGCLP